MKHDIYRSRQYYDLQEYFGGNESRSGLKSSAVSQTQQKTTSSYERPGEDKLISNLAVIGKHRRIRYVLQTLPTKTLVIFSEHFRETIYPPDLTIHFDATPEVNLTNLARYLSPKVHARSGHLAELREEANRILREALEEYIEASQRLEPQWIADRRAYQKYNAARSRQYAEQTKAKQLSFTPPISWEDDPDRKRY